MYDRFFKLSRPPFSMTPDPDALFFTNGHREALAGLSYSISRRKGFAVLEGEAGTGKTTLIRKLLQVLPDLRAQASVVLNPVLTPAEFLELILISLGLTDLPASKAQRLTLLERLLRTANDAGETPVLIVDEAHKLSEEVLEEIRLLTNFETHAAKLLQIVLVGQPDLKAILNRPELWQLKQRASVRLRTMPLTPAEVRSYLQFRWRWAGASDAPPFEEDALPLIAEWSRGIPRLVNSICDNALLLAFADSSRVVTAAEVMEAVRDLDLLPSGRTIPAAARLSGDENTLGNGNGSTKRRNGTHHSIPSDHGGAPLRLEALERYASDRRSFWGFRWRRGKKELVRAAGER